MVPKVLPGSPSARAPVAGVKRRLPSPPLDRTFQLEMAILTPKVLRRGLEFSLIASLLGFAAVLLYRGNYLDFIDSLGRIQPLWLLVGVAVSPAPLKACTATIHQP